MTRGFLSGLATGLLVTPLPLAMALTTRALCGLHQSVGLAPAPPHADEAANLTDVHVLYVSSADYFPALLVSMLSLVQHLSDPSRCSIHVLVPPEDLASAGDLAECIRREVAVRDRSLPKLQIHEARPLPFSTEKFLPFNGRRNQSQMLYARLFAGDYMPDVRRVLYLDADVIIKADIGPLYRMRMEHTIAARPTTWITYLQCWGLPIMQDVPEEFMFNSGVLLIDLDRWRAESVASAVAELLNSTQGCVAEQLAMNAHFKGAFDRLPGHWHKESLGEVPWKRWVAPACSSGILHWTGPNKFWLRPRYRDVDFLVRPHLPRQHCTALQQDLRELYRPDA